MNDFENRLIFLGGIFWRRFRAPIKKYTKNGPETTTRDLGHTIIAFIRNKRGFDETAPPAVERNTITEIEDLTEDGMETSPRVKRARNDVEVVEFEAVDMNRGGNALGNETRFVKLKHDEEDFFFDPPATQAMWLVMELDTYNGHVWYRPAVQMTDVLEEQYKANQGLQVVDIAYTRDNGSKVTHTYEHDLRGEEWVQRKIEKQEDGSKFVKTSKKIIRVVLK